MRSSHPLREPYGRFEESTLRVQGKDRRMDLSENSLGLSRDWE